VQVGAPSKSREAPLALKALYDADVAEEDIILAWHDKDDAGKVRAHPGHGMQCVVSRHSFPCAACRIGLHAFAAGTVHMVLCL
jgi:hypothetical protein